MVSNELAPNRVFISYSHDSAPHRKRVLALAERLREDGVDARLDRYVEGSPPEGWPLWMYNEIAAADAVVVVCTQTYHERALGREETGRGLGATWEGAIITSTLYGSQGRNTKFIPVTFDAGSDDYVPYFLSSATRYDVSEEDGYEALHRHLTGQHATPMRPLGPVKRRPTVSGHEEPGSASTAAETRSGDVRSETPRSADRAAKTPALGKSAFSGRDPVLLRFPDGSMAVFGATRVAVGDDVAISLIPDGLQDTARLNGLRELVGRGQAIGLAYATQALWARIADLRHELAAGQEVWHLTLRPDSTFAAGVMDEIATTGYSADDIAILRARRILLDESLPGRPAFLSKANPWSGGGQPALLESLVRSHGVLTVERSPLPVLFANWTGDHTDFVAVARLVILFWLILANVVETVRRLDLAMTKVDGKPALQVRFEGTRRKVYTNVAAPTIEVDGVCILDAAPSR